MTHVIKKLDEFKTKQVILQKQGGGVEGSIFKIVKTMNASIRWAKKLWARDGYRCRQDYPVLTGRTDGGHFLWMRRALQH